MALLLNSDAISHCVVCRRGFDVRPPVRVLLTKNVVYHVDCYQHAHHEALYRRNLMLGRALDASSQRAKVEEEMLVATPLDDVCAKAPHLHLENLRVGPKGQMYPATYKVDGLDKWDPVWVGDTPYVPCIPRQFFNEAYTVLRIKWKQQFGFSVPECIRLWFTEEASKHLPEGVHLYLWEGHDLCHLIVRLERPSQVPLADTPYRYLTVPEEMPIQRALVRDFVPMVLKQLREFIGKHTVTAQMDAITFPDKPLGGRVTSRVHVYHHEAKSPSQCLLLLDRQAVSPDDVDHAYVFVGAAYDLYRVSAKPGMVVVWPFHSEVPPEEAFKVVCARVSGKQ